MNKTRRIEATIELVRILAAVGIAYALALVTLFAISDNPLYVIEQFVVGPLSSARRIGSIINLAIPFTFTGLCFCFMYAVNKFNLAGEGIFMFSGCIISLMAIISGFIIIPILIITGMVIGIVISAIPAYLDLKFNANIVVVSLMVNSILMFLSIWFLKYTMRDPSIGSLGSFLLPDSVRFASIFGKLRIQAGIAVAVIAVIFVSILFNRMILGYKMRVVGSNPIGGALAGLGGTCEILGNYDRYKWVVSTQHGFDGLMVAVLARRKPILVPVAAMLLAYIRIGADVVNSKGDIPIEFITVIQGIVILLGAAEEFMGRYKKKLIYNAAKENMKSDKDKEVEEILEEK